MLKIQIKVLFLSPWLHTDHGFQTLSLILYSWALSGYHKQPVQSYSDSQIHFTVQGHYNNISIHMTMVVLSEAIQLLDVL